MSIIIKGMEIPRGCNYCHRSYWSNIDGVYKCYLTKSKLQIKDAMTERNADCPMVEIPKGASLVDRNHLLSEYDRQHKGPAGGARKIMEDAPTIFEEGKK